MIRVYDLNVSAGPDKSSVCMRAVDMKLDRTPRTKRDALTYASDGSMTSGGQPLVVTGTLYAVDSGGGPDVLEGQDAYRILERGTKLAT